MANLPEGHFVFAMAASVDSLSHNANFCQRKKLSSDLCIICGKIWKQCKQTLAHILSHCQSAIYTTWQIQHPACVLAILFKHLQQHLLPGTKVTAVWTALNTTELPTDLRTTLVVHSPGQLHLLELITCLEANFSSASTYAGTG